MSPARRPVGRFVQPADRGGALRRSSSLAFPASQIQSLERREGAPPFMQVNFMGLTGPLGVLPPATPSWCCDRLRARKDTTLRDFFDLFQPPHDLAVLPGVGEIPLHHRLRARANATAFRIT